MIATKWNLNALILVAAGLAGCAADVSVDSEINALSPGWQEVSNGALVRVRGALTEDMRFPLRAVLSPDLAEQMGNTVARSVCRATLADGKLVCRGLASVELTVVASNARTTTFRVAAMNPGYTDLTGIYLANSSDVSVEAIEEEGEPEVRPICIYKTWCFGTTYNVITQECLWISSPDDSRCGGGEPVECPPLLIMEL